MLNWRINLKNASNSAFVNTILFHFGTYQFKIGL